MEKKWKNAFRQHEIYKEYKIFEELKIQKTYNSKEKCTKIIAIIWRSKLNGQ